MSQPSFDPCKQWLGIDAVDLGDPHRVLGLAPQELDPQAIIRAATIKLSLLQSVSPGAFAMAHAALLRRVAEARDTLLAEAAAAAPPRFSMPPPPPSVRPAMPPMPGTPPIPAVPLAAGGLSLPPVPSNDPDPGDAAGTSPTIALRTPGVPRPALRPKKAAGGGFVMALVGVLGILAGVLGYQALESRQRPDKGGRDLALRNPERSSKPAPRVDRPRRSKMDVSPAAAKDEPAMVESTDEATAAETSAEPPRPDRMADEERVDPARPAEPAKQPLAGEPDLVSEPELAGKPALSDEPAAVEPDRATPPPAETEPAEADSAETEPAPPPTPSPADVERIESLLSKSFASIQEQAFDDARNTLAAAKEVAADEATRRRIESFFELVEYAEEFFAYREKAVNAVRSGIEYKIPSTSGERLIAIIENTPKELIYREAGKTDRWPRDKIPVAVLTHIVREWFDDRPENRLFLGAYFASKPEPDVAKARAEWAAAQAGGVDVSGLMPLLDDPVILEAAE